MKKSSSIINKYVAAYICKIHRLKPSRRAHLNTLILSFYDAIRQLHIFLSISSTIFKCLEPCKVGLCPHVPKNVAKLWTLELFSSPTSRSCVVSTTKVIQQLKTRVVTCSRINCYVFKVYWSAGTQINEPIDWGTITRKWKTILGFSSPLKSMVSYRDYIRRM